MAHPLRRSAKLSNQRILRGSLLSIAALEKGLDVAIDILYMRIHSDQDQKKDVDPALLEAGRQLLSKLDFQDDNDQEDYKRASVAAVCLAGAKGSGSAKAICQRFRAAVAGDQTLASHHNEAFKALLGSQPLVVLDCLLGGNEEEQKQGLKVIGDMRFFEHNPMGAVHDDQLVEWCNGAPETRYPIAASVITYSAPRAENTGLEWSATALRLLEKAPDRVNFLRGIMRQFRPRSWSGSLAAILEANAKLLDQLPSHSDAAVAEFVTEEKALLAKEIETERRSETEHDRDRDERFE